MELGTSARGLFVELINNVFPSVSAQEPLYNVLALGTILVMSAILYIAARLLIRPQLTKLVYKSNHRWDDALQNHGFFRLEVNAWLQCIRKNEQPPEGCPLLVK